MDRLPGVHEGLKTTASCESAALQLTYCDIQLNQALDRLGCTQSDLWPASASKCSLWKALLFPIFADAGESASFAVQCVLAARGHAVPKPLLAAQKRLDMEGVLARKNLPGIMAFRAALAADIGAARAKHL